VTKGIITVIAGVNGAGKSSIAGAHITAHGGQYFNPDEYCRDLLARTPSMTEGDANAQAWRTGFDLLQRAIASGDSFTFETTLGGDTISNTLEEAMKSGTPVRILYTGLNSPELHIERVAARVSKGGHHIPEEKIRQRWIGSILNMERLIPLCAAVRVFDNSQPAEDGQPNLVLLFAMDGDDFISPPVHPMPEWAKPLALAASKRAHNLP
jgi:predicted ABC-type ATPase